MRRTALNNHITHITNTYMQAEENYDPFGRKKEARMATKKERKKDWKNRISQFQKVSSLTVTKHISS